MLEILVTFALLGSLVLLSYKYLTWHFNDFKKLGLQGPKPQVYLGNFPNMVLGKRLAIYDIDDVYNEYKKRARAIGVFVTRNPQIMILDPALAHDVMVTNFRKYRDNYSSYYIHNEREDKIASRNPFFSRGDAWKSRRSDILGGLTLNKLNQAYPIWKSCAQKLTKCLKEQTTAGNAVIETKNLGFRFTANVMGEFLWGIESNTINGKGLSNPSEPNTFFEMAKDMLAQSTASLDHFYKYNGFPFLRRYGNYRFFSETTDRFFVQLTNDAIALRLKDTSNESRMDFLNYMRQLQLKKQLTNEDVTGHIMATMLDGYETAAMVLVHTLFYLAYNMNAQEKLRSEILSSLDEDGFVSFENLNALTFLEQCVLETIRMITPVSTYSRVCTESTKLEVDKGEMVPIAVGTVIMLPTFSYHHDPDYFPQPYEYTPERFDNGAHLELIKRGIFMPFGDGPRICVGMRLGLLEVKTCIVEILKAYRVKCCAQTMPQKKPDSPTFILGLDGDIFLEYEAL